MRVRTMDVESRLKLIKRLPTEEILVEDELVNMLETGVPIRHYIGFEISGLVHIGSGLVCTSKIADFQKAGIDVEIFLADWHAWINNKLGGDLEFINEVGHLYFKQMLLAGLKSMGGDPDKVRVVYGTNLYHNNDEYWQIMIDVAKNMTLARAKRSITILGRQSAEEGIPLAHLIYPAMQVADIYVQRVNLAHAGTDQRKAHVVARDVGKKLRYNPLEWNGEKHKPVAIHHHVVLGLQQPAVWPIPPDMDRKELMASNKMSKSIPGSAIFVHDPPEVIRKKIRKGFCPAKVIDYNPILDWAKHIIFRGEETEFLISRPAKFGGDITYYRYEDLEKDFAEGKLHPMDLKNGVAEKLIQILEPARKTFESDKKLQEIAERISKSITR